MGMIQDPSYVYILHICANNTAFALRCCFYPFDVRSTALLVDMDTIFRTLRMSVEMKRIDTDRT